MKHRLNERKVLRTYDEYLAKYRYSVYFFMLFVFIVSYYKENIIQKESSSEDANDYFKNIMKSNNESSDKLSK